MPWYETATLTLDGSVLLVGMLLGGLWFYVGFKIGRSQNPDSTRPDSDRTVDK